MQLNLQERIDMATSKTKSTKKRVKVANIPTKSKKLSSKDAKKVKGGIIAVSKLKDKW